MKHQGVYYSPVPEMSEHPIKLWRLRQKPPVTLDDLAAKIRTGKGNLSKLENGLVEPRADTVRRLVEATKGQVTAEQIIFWGRENCRPAA